MKTKKLLCMILAIVMAVSMTAALGISASAIATDATSVCVGETYDLGEHVGEIPFSAEEQDGNLWYFYTTDETKLEVVNYYIEEDAVEGGTLHIFLKGIAVGEGLEILCKQYDAESTSWIDGVAAVNGIYNVIPAPNECCLDLDDSTTDILEEKELEQNYNLTVNEVKGADVTKVRLSWEISDINAARTDNMVWDTENLCWKTDSSSTTINQQGTAKFTLENYSSVKIDATASFQATGSFKGTASYDVTGGKVTLDTANGSDTYSKTNVPTKVINATVTPDDEDFNDLDATTAAKQYGIYTVTIGKAAETVTLTFTNSNSHSTLTYNETEYAYGESFRFSVPLNSTVSIVGAGTSESTFTVDGKTVTQTSSSSWPCQWGTPSGRIKDGAVITEALDIHSASK